MLNFFQNPPSVSFLHGQKTAEIQGKLMALVADSDIPIPEIAEKLGWSEKKLRNILSFDKQITLKQTVAICNALDLEFKVRIEKKNAS